MVSLVHVTGCMHCWWVKHRMPLNVYDSDNGYGHVYGYEYGYDYDY